MPHRDKLPLTLGHVLAAAICTAALGADSAEITLDNALSAVFSAHPYQLPPFKLGWILSAIYLGAILGALLLGWATERVGLRRMLQLLLGWLALTSLLTTATPAPIWLGVFRLLSGLATTSAWALSRLASAQAPLLLRPALKSHGLRFVYTAVCCSLIAGALLVAVRGRACAAGFRVC